jgi:hypothetical protein
MPFIPGDSLIVDGLPTAWFPIDQNLITWAFDPNAVSSSYTLATAGTLYVVTLKAEPSTISNVVYRVSTAGSSLTTSQCFVGVYQNGVLLGSSADCSTAWASTGNKTTALTSPVTVLEGYVQVAFFFNGTTGPALSSGGTLGNIGLSAAQSRYSIGATGATTALPTAPGTLTALAASPWVALS